MNGDMSDVHKPIFCPTHPAENLKNYCKTCEVSLPYGIGLVYLLVCQDFYKCVKIYLK